MTPAALTTDSLLEDLGQVLDQAATTSDDGDMASVWREKPVGLEEFVKSGMHLGHARGLFPRQQSAMDNLLGTDPEKLFTEPGTDGGREYQMAVLLWGKGAGKDFLCSVVVCYIVHVLLCLRDPQGYFGLAAGEPLDVVNVAYNADQAKHVFFTKLKERVRSWRWLRENFNVWESGRKLGRHVPGRPEVWVNDNNIEFPRGIRAFSRNSQNESYEGFNVIAWVMDEASAFLSKLKRENADRIYQTLRTSAVSRFQRKWVGFVISYPRHADDFTMTKLREAQEGKLPGCYADGPASTWEVNHNLGQQGFVEIRPGHSVPIETANDYTADYEEAKARYECDPPLARDAFFREPDRLWDAVAVGKAPVVEWEPTTTTMEVVSPDGEGTIRREFRSVKLTKLGKLAKGTRLFFHGDPGVSNDSFALALGHGVPATIIEVVRAGDVMDEAALLRTDTDPDRLIPWERDVTRTVIDAVIVWQPDPAKGIQVDLQNVEDVIQQLHRRYRLGGPSKVGPTGTFDHWNSAAAIQRMLKRKMNVKDEQWSGPFQLGIYRHARSCFYNDLVTLPDTPSVTSRDPRSPGAIYELERIELIEDRKVDHPEGGSKDIADAVVRVIQHATEHLRGGHFAFGSAYGTPSAYPHTAPTVPVPGKTVDPNTTPKVATPAEREADEKARHAMPLGELVPAEGTIEGRRLGYGSIQQRR